MSAVPLLGKLPKLEDPRTLKLSKYVDREKALAALPTLKPLDLVGAALEVPMYGNDQWGDCGPAAVAHALNAWVAYIARLNGQSVPQPLPQQAVTDFYVAVTTAMGAPFDPATGANDTGVVVLTMLKVLQSVGIAGYKIGAFVEVDITPGDPLYDWASAAFGGLILGYGLPLAAQAQPNWAFPVPAELTGAYAVASWGGHCVFESANNPAAQPGRKVESWGQELDVSDPFDNAYRDEAYAVLASEQDNAAGTTDGISGLAVGDLQADLSRVQAPQAA
jgi:hypothetical protein